MLEAKQRLEQAQWDIFWVPRGTRVIDRPELLYLVSERPVFYLNEVVRTRATAQQLPALMDEVLEAHAHTLSSWTVYDGSDPDTLERMLPTVGYTQVGECDGMVIDVSDFRARESSGVSVERVQDMQQLRDSLYVMETSFGHAETHTDEELQELLATSTGPDARIARFLVRDAAGQPISSGSLTLHPALDLVYLWGGSTLPEARGKGAYHALLAARVAFARQRGIRTVGVYAITNTSAPIVARCGFQRCGHMTKWHNPPRS